MGGLAAEVRLLYPPPSVRADLPHTALQFVVLRRQRSKQTELSNTHKCEILTHWGGAVRTNVEIDDKLVSHAMRTSGARTKKAVVEAGLRLLVKTHSQTSIRKLRGKVQWEGDLNGSRMGRVRE